MSFSLKKLSALRPQILRAITILLIILGAVNILVYNTIAELVSIRKLKESVTMTCGQMGISYETTLSYMTEIVNKIAIFDFSNYDIAVESGKVYEFQTTMNRELTSIVSMSSYIASAYIYIAELDKVFDSRLSPLRVTSLENFSDRELFGAARSGRTIIVGPRILSDRTRAEGMNTVITLISPLTFRSGGSAWLAVNINADLLYTAVSRNIGVARGFTFYAYNTGNTVILHSADKSRLYTALNPEALPVQKTEAFYYFHRNQPITAAYESSFLNWTFVLEAPADPVINDLSSYIVINLVIVLIILGIISLVVFIKTGQVSSAAAAMSEVFWKEALLDRVYIDDEMIQQLSGGDFVIEPEGSFYGVIGVSISGEGSQGYGASNLVKPACEKLKSRLNGDTGGYKIVSVSKNIAALALKYRPGETAPEIHRRMAGLILESLAPEEQGIAYVSMSGLQKNFALLPLCYKQCEDTLKYKICLESHILDYSHIREFDTEYEFPAELAHQLNNNIAAGSKSGCASYLDKIFAPLEKKNIISDEQIINMVIVLQDGAFKTVSDLPVPIKLNTRLAVNTESARDKSLVELKAALLSFCEKICDEIIAAKESQRNRLSAVVMEHIEKNCFKDHLMSLVSVADDLRIGKSQVSSIVKEATGLDFPEFINKKRIKYAKDLLSHQDMTIEEIAKASGYNYSYYFIKIFKSLEGVTPGQYRAATGQLLR